MVGNICELKPKKFIYLKSYFYVLVLYSMLFGKKKIELIDNPDISEFSQKFDEVIEAEAFECGFNIVTIKYSPKVFVHVVLELKNIKRIHCFKGDTEITFFALDSNSPTLFYVTFPLKISPTRL